ncbi:hypothetical protein Taro_044693 [Colocasia esculenta]|uniref:PUM-HD domain-containing protein n=1 Tax=Colocasia esculenta TaxID=4460 RepID=A0A843X5Q9_COLES|nr:hypothetical protein [Colocasia esculenta]
MEGGVATKGGQEEIKMLVGETPNATSGNPQTLVCPRQIPQPQNEVNSSASTLYACVHEFPRVANQGGRMASYSSSNFACNPAAGKHQGSGDDYVSVERRPVNPDELNLPDDQSLTSALENLSIDHGVSGEPTRQSSVRYNIAPHVHGLRLYGQHNAPANKFSPVDSADMSVLQAPTPLDALNIANQTLQTYAPLTISEINKFNIRANCQMDSHELEGQKPETLPGGFRDLQHRAPVYTGDTSFISGMNNPQFLFSKSFQAVDFRSPTFQKHYCSDRGNALGWSENQQGLALMGSGSCKYYVPGYCGKENFTFPHARKQTSGSGIKYSGRDFRPVPALNRVGKQASPEKILTRSKGSRSLRIPDASLLPSNDLVNHAGFKQMVPPNSQFYPVVQTSASFQVDDGDTKGISDNSYYRLMTGSPQPDYNYDSLDDAVGRIYSLSKDQTGCRFLQETLKNCTSQDVYKIFIEITSHIVDLTTDPFGNYLLQKLVEVCNEDQKMCIIREITSKPGELIRISCDMHGTRVVQKVIEALKTTEQVSMVVSSLKPGVMPLIKDTNGNHTFLGNVGPKKELDQPRAILGSITIPICIRSANPADLLQDCSARLKK